MTKKHFEMIAKEIRQIINPAHALSAAAAVAAAGLRSNPRFNVQKFYEACGVIREND